VKLKLLLNNIKMINMKRIIIIIAILFSVNSQFISAQATQEVSAFLGGGFSPLSYQLQQGGTRSGGFGGEFGVGYTYFFDPIERLVESGSLQRFQFGIHSGLGLGIYTAKATIGTGQTTRTEKDDGGHDFVFEASVSNYAENQTALFLVIPVMAQMQVGDQYYAKAGIKAGIPISGKFSSNNVVTTKGRYPNINPYPIEEFPFAGFETSNRNPKGDIDLGITVMLALEAGMRFRLTSDLTLYAGLYFDYGLNNSLKTDNNSFIDYVPPTINQSATVTTNSVLSEYTDKANVMAVGVKVSLYMRNLW